MHCVHFNDEIIEYKSEIFECENEEALCSSFWTRSIEPQVPYLYCFNPHIRLEQEALRYRLLAIILIFTVAFYDLEVNRAAC